MSYKSTNFTLTAGQRGCRLNNSCVECNPDTEICDVCVCNYNESATHVFDYLVMSTYVSSSGCEMVFNQCKYPHNPMFLENIQTLRNRCYSKCLAPGSYGH